MECLFTGKHTEFGSADLASLQTKIIEKLIVKRAEMLVMLTR